MPKTKPDTAMQTRKRFRRIQSMAGPIPCDARAQAPGLVQARGWKARAFRAAPTKDEAFQRQMRQTQWLDFGKVFLAFAVAGRQGLLKLVDDLGLDIGMGRRDAVRALVLLYATERYPQARESFEWLARSAARLLCPASGLAVEEAGLAEKLLEAAGRPGLLVRFLKKFKALADAVYRSGREIAFIDSEAADAENASPELAALGSGEHENRWLYAVLKDTGLPLGLVAIRENGEDGEDREDGEEEEACTEPSTGDWRCCADGQEDGPAGGQEDCQGAAEAPGEAEGGVWPPSGDGGSSNDDDSDDEDDWYRRGYGSLFDTGRLKASFDVLAKAGLRAQSCLLSPRRLDDPGISACFDGRGKLAVPFICQVRTDDPVRKRELAARCLADLKRPANLFFFKGTRIFAASWPVKAGALGRPVWMHAGLFCGSPTPEQEAQARARRPAEFCTPEDCLAFEEDSFFVLATGKRMTAEAAFKEYLALLDAAETASQAPCRRASPRKASPALRRGHELFCAMGFALWGLLADAMQDIDGVCLPDLMELMEVRLRCRLHARWISLENCRRYPELRLAFETCGLDLPRTLFLDGPRLRYDPLRDYPLHAEWDEEDEEFMHYLSGLAPDDLGCQLLLRPFWPRRHRPWRMGARRTRPLPGRRRIPA
ncbi:MAG: hypothetical protein J5863_09275 [Desulfovibrio sp.]|nr:hypothetical protein [Desulfovibrio sp.]